MPTLTVTSDHKAVIDARTIARAGEIGVVLTVNVDATVKALGTGKKSYIDFQQADGNAYYAGDYDCSSGTFNVTLGVVDTILTYSGELWMQFVLRDDVPPTGVEVWKSEKIKVIVEDSINATLPMSYVAVPPMTAPTTFPASNVTIADVASIITATNVESALAEIVHNSYNSIFVNVKYPPAGYTGAVGDGGAQDSDRIQALLDGLDEGSTLFFPAGTYLLTNVTMTKCINIIGNSTNDTILLNTAATAALTINPTSMNIHRNFITNITIKGDGTAVYGSDATSGNGLVINDSPYLVLDNVRIVNHGGYGLLLTGMVWTMEIANCLIGYNKLANVYFTASSSAQKNDIKFRNCSITGGGASGITLWGVSISIEKCSIDDHKTYGIEINCDNVSTAYSACSISIKNNYFENNARHHIYAKSAYATLARYIRSLSIQNNYMYQDVAKLEASYVAGVKIITDPVDTSSPTMRNFTFLDNFIDNNDEASLVYADFSNCLGADAIIRGYYDDVVNEYISYGMATLVIPRTISLNGYCNAVGVTWSDILYSDDIATGTTVTFPITLSKYNTLIKMGVYVDTDSTDFTIAIKVKYRDQKTVGSYSDLWSYTAANKNGAQLIETNHAATYSATPKRALYSDLIMQITVTRNVAGTYLKLGNPYLDYVQ